MRKIDKIIIHCTATPEGRKVTVADVDAWHRQRGFAKIGYHYLIGLNGEVWQGRKLDEIGAHTTGQNANSIGICYVGGLAADGKTAKDTRTAAQKEALKNLIVACKKSYPTATIHAHYEFANKACPCFDVKKWCKETGLQ
ncbi:MAG: N-acetylmuramoyl-L-alanine amidase [Prevotellaceae bacterium]|jgi:N-acetylmuramoyl-L-alanine amidase|nr:N-acetylmuramoyl-L-alanine amidase [Prevotellaceae bacterium]